MTHENSAEMDETRLKLGNASDQATIDISIRLFGGDNGAKF